MKLLLGIAGLVLLANVAYAQQAISFMLSAQNLPTMDKSGNEKANSDPDPFVELSGAVTGRSDTLEDNKNPSWGNTFFGVYYPQEPQEVFVEVRDNDPWNPDDHIGWASFTLEEIKSVGRISKPIEDAGNNRGTLYITTLSGVGAKKSA